MIINNTKDIMMEIKTIMLQNGIKKTDLAKKLNISRSTLGNRFSQNNTTIDTLLEICNALDINMDINFIPKDDAK